MGIAPRLILFLLALLCAAPFTVSAQYQYAGLPGVEKTAILSYSPEHPQPGETVHLVVQSPVINLPKASIVWYANGKAIASGVGLTETTVAAGKLGETTDIEVDVVADEAGASATATIIPTEVDLLYDSTSYTPPFYLGRALPSMGSQLRMQALARFKKNDGTLVKDADIVYSWTKNGIDIPRASGAGKNSVIIASPIMYGADRIVVKAEANGGFAGSASVVIPSTKPLLVLYEDNPLYGYMYHQALAAQSLSQDAEMTIAATPFFARPRSPNDSALQYEWRVNDQSVHATSTPSEITLGAKGGGLARVALDLNDDGNIFFNATGAWTILFSPHAQSSAPGEGNLLPVQ